MNPYVIGGVALVIAIMGWQLKSSITRNGELQARLEVQASETLECTAANTTTIKTISQLEVTIKKMVEERRVDIVMRERVLDERDQELSAARAEAKILRDEVQDDFNESPDCADLASLRVDFFCPANAERLRQRSVSQGSH